MLMKNDGKHRTKTCRLVGKLVHIVLTQMSAKKGIKLYGHRAVAAMFKELKQLNDGAKPGNPVVIPTCPDKLSSREKSEALEAVNLIKMKRDGNIKGRTCANGAK